MLYVDEYKYHLCEKKGGGGGETKGKGLKVLGDSLKNKSYIVKSLVEI